VAPYGEQPMAARFEFLDHPGPLAFAHRGGAAEAAENSWSAFEHAVGLGYKYMETDIRATADGVALAFHDPTLARTAKRPGPVAGARWGQLRSARLDDARPIPRLDELLGSWPHLRWNIDVKTAAAVAPVVEAVTRAGADSRVLLTSFSGWRLARLRRALGPQVATGAGRGAIATLLAAKSAPVALATLRRRPAAAQVPLRARGLAIVDEAFIATCHSRGIAVHVWTIDDRTEICRLLELGVDGIMTDRPTVLKEVLTGRAQWA
jgi:glycerophosphoryl diester phosphodiesterase